jgi:hypothetical protein
MAIYQAIETKYLGPTNFRSGRIKARAWAGSVTMPYDHALNAEDNHRAAALLLQAKYGWKGTFAQGGNAAGNGYVFVNVEGA